jgi:hypothetical protein
VADLDGDGKLDLVVANNTAGTISVLRGNGDGSFRTAVNYRVGANPSGLVVADLNSDGALDVVVTNDNSGTVSVLLGNGDGTLRDAVNYATGPRPYALAAADFDGDGNLDLVVANGPLQYNTVSLLRGNGDGTFRQREAFVVTSGTFPTDVAVGDFNGDGAPDLAVTVFSNNTVSVLLNAAQPVTVQSVMVNDGSAQRSMVTSLTVTFTGVVSLDEGALELRDESGELVKVALSASVVEGKTVVVITFVGNGVIAGSLPDGSYTLRVRGDRVHDGWGRNLDGDGDGLLGGDRTESFFRLFGDANGDGKVDRTDLALFLSTYSKHAGEEGYLAYFDYNGDGVIDDTDSEQFLARFG